jgi:hypothetical protein
MSSEYLQKVDVTKEDLEVSYILLTVTVASRASTSLSHIGNTHQSETVYTEFQKYTRQRKPIPIN